MAATDDIARLTTFQHHINDMRNLVMCKICLNPLYEPFILACGHTYCYGCLRSWFSGLDSRRRKKNCPDCRSDVKLTPAPNYILRDLVHMFINRTELLPEDETVDEHIAKKTAEADLLARDRDGNRLFDGVFRNRFHPLADYGALHDITDGVLRCPHCHWELEEGMCNHCGYEIDDDEYPDFSDDDDEDDESLTIDEGSIPSDGGSSISYDSEHGLPHPFYGIRSAADAVDASIGTDVYSELDYGTADPYAHEEDEDEDEMHSFIDDHDEDEPDEVDEDDMEGPAFRYQFPSRGRPYQIPDDEDEDEDSQDEDEEHDIDENNNWHPGGPIEVEDIRDYESSDESQEDGQDQNTNYDESDDENRSITPVAIPIVPRRRPIVISDDDDDDDDDDGEVEVETLPEGRNASEGFGVDTNDSSDSEDTISQSQRPSRTRQQLENPRKRRLTPETWRSIARGRFEAPSNRQASRRTHNVMRASRVSRAVQENVLS